MSTTSDRRRITGPANAKPAVFAPLPKEYASKQVIDLERENDIKSQISRTFIKTGLITNANGSAYLEADGNIVSVLIYGPRPIRGSFQERANLSVNLNDSSDLINELMNKKFCQFIENNFLSVINLDKYPKSGIDIFINVISVQNLDQLSLKLLSLISDITTLALINAGIEILDIVASGFDYENNTVISFIKQDEIVGILSESLKPLDNLKEIIGNTSNKANVIKSSLISYLMETTTSK